MPLTFINLKSEEYDKEYIKLLKIVNLKLLVAGRKKYCKEVLKLYYFVYEQRNCKEIKEFKIQGFEKL